jgi:nucleoid DNA-binding protein
MNASEKQRVDCSNAHFKRRRLHEISRPLRSWTGLGCDVDGRRIWRHQPIPTLPSLLQGRREKPTQESRSSPLFGMNKMNKGQLIAQVASKTGKTPYKTEQALNTVLDGIKHALVHGREVDLGPKLGRLKVIARKRKRVIKKNLKGRCKASVVELHKKHPRSVRLLGRNRDLSENPQPTIVTKEEPKQQTIPARSRHFAVAIPSWRRRFR